MHVCHVSTAASLAAIERAKAAGVRVTAEVTPHHLTLTDEAIESLDPNLKMNPPLRAESDRQALVAALKSGLLDCVATDHAPHAAEEKDVPFEEAPFGTHRSGDRLQRALRASSSKSKALDLGTLVTRMSTAPARIAGLAAAEHRPGRRRQPLRRRPQGALDGERTRRLQSRSFNSRLARPRARRAGSSSPSPPAASPGRTLPSPALIVLEDGAAFRGEALAGQGAVGGEIVFNTSMAGYQEIATDPSYCGQLVTFTFPMNGNYGADPERDESGKAHARAIIAREITNYRFNRASRATWLDWLAEHGVLAVSGVDTRALTRHIRDKGALRAVVSTETDDVKHLRKAAQGLPKMGGLDLAKVVTLRETRTRRRRPKGPRRPTSTSSPTTSASSARMLRYLGGRGFRVTVVPAQTSAREVLKHEPDGVFLSNGPGDPAAVTYAVKAVERLLGKVPVFGICLGHQLLAQALGYSHLQAQVRPPRRQPPGQGPAHRRHRDHDAEPRLRRASTTPWHGAEITHVNLNDGTVEGVAAAGRFAFSVQYHPESTPGPHDSLYLFDRFRDEIARFRKEAPDAAPRRSPQDPHHRLRARSSSGRPASSTTRARRPARCCSKRATRSCSSTATRRRS